MSTGSNAPHGLPAVVRVDPGTDREPGSPVSVLLVSGSTRPDSTNSAALRTVAALAPAGVRTVLYDGLADLPAFNPDDDREGVRLPPAVARLRRQIEAADGVLFSTPEYAGTLPGSFKNLLDWTVGGGQLDGKPVASLQVAAPGRGGGAEATLVTVLDYVNAARHDAPPLRVYVPRDSVGPDGLVGDPDLRAALTRALADFLARLA
ncbi:NADPH-dependent FMN reductase [Micromonospora zhanjiangensis]